jgi:hypothetical protein
LSLALALLRRLPSQLQLGVPLPGYPGGANGLIMSLSQSPCNGGNAQCCNSAGICANWAGAHLVSAGCVQFGVLELEAAFNMPQSGGALCCVVRFYRQRTFAPRTRRAALCGISSVAPSQSRLWRHLAHAPY